MSIRVSCPNPHCGKAVQVSAEWAGKRVKCPRCRQPLAIPAPTADTEPSAPRRVGWGAWLAVTLVLGVGLLCSLPAAGWYSLRARTLQGRLADAEQSVSAMTDALEQQKHDAGMSREALRQRLAEAERKSAGPATSAAS